MQAEYTGEASTVDGKKTSPPRSNVSRIGRATLLEDDTSDFEQIVYYQAGVAAVAENSRLQTFTESAWGTGVLSNVREAYGFICNNYDYGDEIYITGFSRGAFTARSVAGLIGKCGILTKVGMDQFYEALDYYQNSYDKLKAGPCPVSEEVGRRVLNLYAKAMRSHQANIGLGRNYQKVLSQYQPSKVTANQN